jgi:hypothetical protein
MELVKMSGCVDVSPRGSHIEDDDGVGPLTGETLRTNQLAINVGLMKMAVEMVDDNVQRGLAGHDDAIDSLGGQLHDMRIHISNNPDAFSDANASVWEGLSAVNGKVDGAHQQLTSDASSLVTAAVTEMRLEFLASVKAEARREFMASVNLVRTDMHSLMHECGQVSRDYGALNVKISDMAREQALIKEQPTFDPSFYGDWQHVLEFFVRNTTPGSGRVGDVLEH